MSHHYRHVLIVTMLWEKGSHVKCKVHTCVKEIKILWEIKLNLNLNWIIDYKQGGQKRVDHALNTSNFCNNCKQN